MKGLPVGSKSLLFGAHHFILHPLFVALAWRKLYGSWPKQIPIWLAFFLHDIGYWGLDNMDGETGQQHPARGAFYLSLLCDKADPEYARLNTVPWLVFCAGHSRYYADKIGIQTSKLMRADKYATCLVPLPLYLLLVVLSGECWEYVMFHRLYVQIRDGGRVPERGKWGNLLWWATNMRADWRKRFGPGAPEGEGI